MRNIHSVEYFLCQNRRVRLNSVEGLEDVQVARRYEFFNIEDSVPRGDARLSFREVYRGKVLVQLRFCGNEECGFDQNEWSSAFRCVA